MKDILFSVNGFEFLILPFLSVSDGFIFFLREKQCRVSSLLCFTSAHLISRPGSFHGRQISFSRMDVMSRQWVDTGQCGGTPLMDGNHSSVLIFFVLFRLVLSLQSTLFFCEFLTVFQERNRSICAHKWTELSLQYHHTLVCELLNSATVQNNKCICIDR